MHSYGGSRFISLHIEVDEKLTSDHYHRIADTVEKKIGYKFDIITELDCTSPLRTIEDIKGAIDLLKSKKVSNIITGSESRRSPYFNLVEEDTNGFVKL